MKLLVTGGAGFIGSNFIHYVLENTQDVEITNLDLLTYAGNLENLKDIEADSRYTFVHGNITDAKLLETLVPDVDAIVHLAAESHVDRSILNPGAFIQTNIVGTFALLEAARKYGKRFHHVSTDEVFGELNDPAEKFQESTPYNPRSPYSASKAASDHLVRAYFHTYNLPITISNCSNNYGPYQFPEKLISLAVTNLLEDKKIPVYGEGTQVRDWLYVEDHCRAIYLILQKGRIGETYCIGGEEFANIKVVSMIREILKPSDSPDNWIEHVKDRPGHDSRYAMDYGKIEEELGWQPKTNFEIGLRQTIEWFQENETWWEKVKSGEYQRYYKEQYGKQ